MRKLTLLLSLTVLLAVLSLAACDSGAGSGSGNTLTMGGSSFVGSTSLSITAGQAVTFDDPSASGGIHHLVTGSNGQFSTQAGSPVNSRRRTVSISTQGTIDHHVPNSRRPSPSPVRSTRRCKRRSPFPDHGRSSLHISAAALEESRCRGGRRCAHLARRRGAAGEASAQPRRGNLGAPGGYIEFAESFEHTATRETREELGIEIANVRFVCITRDIFKQEDRSYVTVWMQADYASGTPSVKAPESFPSSGGSSGMPCLSRASSPCATYSRATFGRAARTSAWGRRSPKSMRPNPLSPFPSRGRGNNQRHAKCPFQIALATD